METAPNDQTTLNSIVQEVISEAHIDPSLMLPEEQSGAPAGLELSSTSTWPVQVGTTFE